MPASAHESSWDENPHAGASGGAVPPPGAAVPGSNEHAARADSSATHRIARSMPKHPLWHEHDLALHLALLDARERVGGGGEWHRRVDRGRELAGGDPREQLI